MKEDTFFTQDNCDRCGGRLTARTMSWFNDQTICLACSRKEDEIKRALKDPSRFEGCGFVPMVDPENQETADAGTNTPADSPDATDENCE